MKKIAALLPLCMLIAACSQSDAPSEKMEAAAEELVEAVLETPSPDQAVQLARYAPRNDCADLDGAEPFLAALGAAIEMRDTDLLIALSADDVKLGFGGEDGADNLRANLDGPEPNLWADFASVVTLGCADNSQGGITMPYYFAKETQLDPFVSMIVTGNEIPVRIAAEGDAQVVATVSWEEVEILRGETHSIAFGEDQQGWSHVRLPATDDRVEMEGYIATRNLRSVIDYRLIAASRNGRWRITAFLAGD